MLSIKPFTSYNIVDILNKPLYFIESDQLNVCNLISPDDLSFFQSIIMIITRKLFIMNMKDLYVPNAIFQ